MTRSTRESSTLARSSSPSFFTPSIAGHGRSSGFLPRAVKTWLRFSTCPCVCVWCCLRARRRPESFASSWSFSSISRIVSSIVSAAPSLWRKSSRGLSMVLPRTAIWTPSGQVAGQPGATQPPPIETGPLRKERQPPYASAVSACPSCGHENEPGAKFCSACGTPLTVDRPPARTERKVVTVLFADLVGFTARAERLDPEDVQAVLEPYHARLRSELERFGGTVEKFIGDAVKALFGAPVAHEDDPERAVRAALAIRDWITEQGKLEVRIGVNTGEALINLTARPEAGEGMAAGDVVNATARIETAAPTNGILVGESTYRATANAIDYGEPSTIEAKGKEDPVVVWEARQAHSRYGVDVVRDAATPLVGRNRELEALKAA